MIKISLEIPGRLARRLTLAALALLLAAPILGYTVILKDGSQLIARTAYQVEGDRAIITLRNGTQITVALSNIDLAKTKSFNAGRPIDATVIDTESRRSRSRATSSRGVSTIQQLERSCADRSSTLDRRRGVTSQETGPRRTLAGFLDLGRFERYPAERSETLTELQNILRRLGLSKLGFYRGSSPERILLDISAESSNEVMAALKAVGEAYVELEARGKPIEIFEIYMQTSSGRRAAQFTLTQDNARLLGKGIVEPSDFFVEYVEY